jgi:hypothetical protein
MHNMFLWYNTCNLDIENQSIIPYYVLENKPKTNEINQRKMSTWYYKCKLVRSVRFCLNANFLSTIYISIHVSCCIGALTGWIKPKIVKLIFAISSLCTQHIRVRDWFARNQNNVSD